jgi:hypothetical protein
MRLVRERGGADVLRLELERMDRRSLWYRGGIVVVAVSHAEAKR